MPDSYHDYARRETVAIDPIQVIDNFSDGNDSEWRDPKTDWSVVSDPLQSGNVYRHDDVSSRENSSASLVGDGLPLYPKYGDLVSYLSSYGSGGTSPAGVFLGVQSIASDGNADGYIFSLNGSSVNINKFNGNYISLASNSHSTTITQDTIYDLQVKQQSGGTLTLDAYEWQSGTLIQSVSTTDTEFGEGGVACRGSGIEGDNRVHEIRII